MPKSNIETTYPVLFLTSQFQPQTINLFGTVTQQNHSDVLLPCPFCGSNDVVEPCSGFDSTYYGACNSCGCFGPTSTTRANAIAAWNKRAIASKNLTYALEIIEKQRHDLSAAHNRLSQARVEISELIVELASNTL